MPVTNFTSVISAQSVGTADVAALAASFDKLSGSIDGATKKSNDLNAHPGFSAFADKVRQGIENPLAAVGDAVDSALKAIGPAGTAISAARGLPSLRLASRSSKQPRASESGAFKCRTLNSALG